MDRVEEGSYVLIGGRNHRILEVDYLNKKVLCYWVAKPKEEKWVEWDDSFEIIGHTPL